MPWGTIIASAIGAAASSRSSKRNAERQREWSREDEEYLLRLDRDLRLEDEEAARQRRSAAFDQWKGYGFGGPNFLSAGTSQPGSYNTPLLNPQAFRNQFGSQQQNAPFPNMRGG